MFSTLLPEVVTDPECWSRIRQDSVFLFRIQSHKCLKNWTRIRSHFSISAVARVCVVISEVKPSIIFGCLDCSRSSNRSRILILKIYWTRIQQFWNRNGVGKVTPANSTVFWSPSYVSLALIFCWNTSFSSWLTSSIVEALFSMMEPGDFFSVSRHIFAGLEGFRSRLGLGTLNIAKKWFNKFSIIQRIFVAVFACKKQSKHVGKMPGISKKLTQKWSRHFIDNFRQNTLILKSRSFNQVLVLTTQGRRQLGEQWRPSPHLKSVTPISRLATWLLHVSNIVFLKFGPSWFLHPLLLNPGDGPVITSLTVLYYGRRIQLITSKKFTDFFVVIFANSVHFLFLVVSFSFL